MPMPISIGNSPRLILFEFNLPKLFSMPCAVFTEFIASSERGNGAPNSPIMASPINLSKIPSCSSIISTISDKYSFNIETVARAPISSERVVKPRISENSIVTGCKDPLRFSSACSKSCSTTLPGI